MADNQSSLADKINSLNLQKPHVASKVYNEQCVVTFATPFSDEGIFVNLNPVGSSYHSFARHMVDWDHTRTGSTCYLNITHKKVKITEEDKNADVNVLGIGVDGGFSLDGEYRTEKSYRVYLIPEWEFVEYPSDSLSAEISEVLEAVIKHSAPDEANMAAAWVDDPPEVSPYALDMQQLDNGKKISPNPADWKCEESGATENLWLNLGDGHIGDGRSAWDGSGGNNGALNHYNQMKELGYNFPIVVKLGTITPAGADCFDYCDDKPCLVPDLGKYLAHWGINIMDQVKTVMTTQEKEILINKEFMFDKIMGGDDAEPVTGAGLIGLDNLGNSCYMNSVLQVMFSLPNFHDKYVVRHDELMDSVPVNADIAKDFPMQMAKLGRGLLTDAYVEPNSVNTALSPQMIRSMVATGHVEFTSRRQQDAEEYVRHFLNFVKDQELANFARVGDAPTLNSSFEFEVEERWECAASKQVRYNTAKQCILKLNIDLDKATNRADVEEQREAKRQRLEETGENAEANKSNEEPDIVPNVAFEACLGDFMAGEFLAEWRSPATGVATGATKTMGLKTFPDSLMVQMQRYYIDQTWVPQKMDVTVNVPSELNLEFMRSAGLQADEVELSKDRVATFEVRPDLITAVMNMGFSQNAGIRGAKATNNGSQEEVVNWVLAHMADPDINDPLPDENTDASGSSVDPELLATVQAFTGGMFSVEQCMFALEETKATSADVVVGWLFDNQSSLGALMVAAAEKKSRSQGDSITDGSPQYRLKAIISHLGSSVGSGHYVSHILKDGQWYFFNDNKVELVREPPFDVGYLYLFERA